MADSKQPISDAALSRIEEAYVRFSDTVSKTDARQLQSTELKDVWQAAKEIESRLGKTGSYRNLRRLQPFLSGLGHYSEAVSILCNGTPYLPWLWAPVKLLLQISSDHLSALEKLMKAYAEIADTLPRFDLLSSALKERQDFQAVLAVFYSDILEFHRRAYKFFRAKSWKRFFDSSWGRFDIRFKGVIGDLRYHANLVDKEANAHSIAIAEEWRQSHTDSVRKTEDQRAVHQFQAVLGWLDLKEYPQEDFKDTIADKCHENTCDWLLDHVKTKVWLDPCNPRSGLWLNGKPGSGKSVLCAQLVRYFRADKSAVFVYHACNFRDLNANSCSHILRETVGQLIKQSRTCIGLVYDEFVAQGIPPSKTHLKRLIPTLLGGCESPIIIVDGLDESPVEEQKELLNFLCQLLAPKDNMQPSTKCRIAMFSRDTPIVRKYLKKFSIISLNEEREAINKAIEAFVDHEIRLLRNDLDDGYTNDESWTMITNQVLSKADGMFLWVRLVLVTMKNLSSLHDLERAVEDIPEGLDEAYGRILQVLSKEVPRSSTEKVSAVLSLIAFAARPLKTYEVLDGATFCNPPHRVDERTKLFPPELDRYEPLIEINSSGYVSFVHFTVKHLDLVDPRVETQQRVRNIASGFYGFHRYALACWLFHVEEINRFFEKSACPLDLDLVSHFKKFLDRYDDIQRREGLDKAHVAVSDTAEARLTALKSFPKLREIATTAQDHQRQCKEIMNGRDTCEHNDGSTSSANALLVEASAQYDAIVRQLISADWQQNFPFLTEEIVGRYKRTFADEAFQCRFSTCSRSSKGFADEVERDRHELTHQPRFNCHAIECPFASNIGFRTITHLKRHCRKYHPERPPGTPKFFKSPPLAANHSDTNGNLFQPEPVLDEVWLDSVDLRVSPGLDAFDGDWSDYVDLLDSSPFEDVLDSIDFDAFINEG